MFISRSVYNTSCLSVWGTMCFSRLPLVKTEIDKQKIGTGLFHVHDFIGCGKLFKQAA